VHPGKDDLLRAAREGEMRRRQVETTAVAG
jgi:hypothetical protein